ncbi:MAG: hypothetical protein JW976_02240 [Syntrophaceae bacterium]|nr:hypothetical protein [Syntrophaceae bacterium]
MKRNKKIHFNALLQFINLTRKEIDQCAEAKAYLAGCVLIGAMTEYINFYLC